MRKYLLVITLVLSACIAANAQSVSKAVAAAKATAFLQLKSDTQLQLLKSPYETLYLFAIDGGGFVIVSADNRVQPILGYSLQSNLNAENLPQNFSAWLDSYDRQIRSIMEDATLPIHSGWLGQGSPKSGVEGYDSIVGPLLTTTWDQSPLYNRLCPLDGGHPTMTGCIATAMAQVMKYWNWPATGVGQHSYSTYHFGTLSADFGATTYDWANMPSSLTSSSSNAQVAAVATLMYHCGVSVEMEYGIMASGIRYNIMYNRGLNSPCPENALRTYFKYSPSMLGVRRTDFSGDEWTALIKNEIDHRRPVLYSGLNSTEGHSFVCDGYDTNGYFHFNWGWSGEADGYFTFSNLNPLETNFNSSQDAIIGIEPDTLFGNSRTCTITAISADTLKGTVTGSGVYNYRDTVTLLAQPASGYRFLRWSNGSSVNPYPLLAYDINLTAYFGDALAEDGDIISYTGSEVNNSNFYSLNISNRIGIKIPASVLPGHNYLSYIEFYHYVGKLVVYVHRGGDEAPGPVIYAQPFEIPSGGARWYRVRFETPVPIDTNNNLWVTIRSVDDGMILYGAAGLGIYDASWFSPDNGATWTHLNEIPEMNISDDINICWLIRCGTTHDSVVSTHANPEAFLITPKQSNVGDTVQAEIIHSTASTVEWNFGDADAYNVSSDTAFIVWNTQGLHPVSATVVGDNGRTILSNTILIAECGNPVNTFPYDINFTEQDAFLRACWQWNYYGENMGYFFATDYIALLVTSRVNNYYVSPLIDLADQPNIWLKLTHRTPGNCLATIEISQGGMDSADFTAIYTLPTSNESSGVLSQPINLSEHYQGNPIRLAIHLRSQEGQGNSRFELQDLSLYADNIGIDEVAGTTLAVSPNPARQAVTVTLPDPEGIFTLFDATGRQLIQSRTSSTQTTVNVSTLPQGIYLLQFTSPRGTTTTRFLVQ